MKFPVKQMDLEYKILSEENQMQKEKCLVFFWSPVDSHLESFHQLMNG